MGKHFALSVVGIRSKALRHFLGVFDLFREDLRTAHAFAKLQRGRSFQSTYTRLLV